MGVITGEMLVDGRQRDESFQRKTGYVQQQDLHLQTSTVREALRFSALLRQPRDTPRAEKIAYVEEVIKLLDMQEYADAVVGVPGEGQFFMPFAASGFLRLQFFFFVANNSLRS
jgi:ABC-type multidrug transport system ATPase subunit